MLPRTLEPEVMDTAIEAHDYDQMDHSEVNRVFVDDMQAAFDVSGDILDVGTGTALIPIEVCKRIDECRIMAIDLSQHMLERARLNLELDGFTHQIQLEFVDSKQMPYPDGMFDIVMSNSIVHHIPEPLTVLAESVRVTRPDGRLFFRDLTRPADVDTLEQLVTTYAGDENDHQQKMFRESLHAALTLDEVRQMVTSLGFAADSVQMTSDRHWTWVGEKDG